MLIATRSLPPSSGRMTSTLGAEVSTNMTYTCWSPPLSPATGFPRAKESTFIAGYKALLGTVNTRTLGWTHASIVYISEGGKSFHPEYVEKKNITKPMLVPASFR